MHVTVMLTSVINNGNVLLSFFTTLLSLKKKNQGSVKNLLSINSNSLNEKQNGPLQEGERTEERRELERHESGREKQARECERDTCTHRL